MIEKANGQSCQATNFLKAFSSIPESTLEPLFVTHDALLRSAIARRLALTEDASSQLQNTLETRIQLANRFLLDQISLDTRRIDDAAFRRLGQVLVDFRSFLKRGTKDLRQNFCTESTVKMHCMNCRHETFRSESSRSIDIDYKRWVATSYSHG